MDDLDVRLGEALVNMGLGWPTPEEVRGLSDAIRAIIRDEVREQVERAPSGPTSPVLRFTTGDDDT